MATRTTKATNLKAKDIMSCPLVYARTTDTIRQLASLLLNKNISGVPVLDPLDNLIGVITKTDVLRYERHRLSGRSPTKTLHPVRSGDTLEYVAKTDHLEETDQDLVEQWMTPHVLGVATQASLKEISQAMNLHRVHRLFVRDEQNGSLVGVITTFDILRRLAESKDQ